MTVRDNRRAAVPPLVKEEVQMRCLRVNNLLSNNAHQIAELLFQLCIGPDTVQAGICLQDVKMRVHRLLLVRIFFAQAKVSDLAPFAVKSLKITVQLTVNTLLFYEPEKPHGLFERLAVACGHVMPAEGVYKKGEGIYLFFSIERGTVAFEAPVCTAIFFIEEVAEDIVPCPCGHLEVQRVLN